MNDIETARISEHFYDTSHWINDAFNQNEAKVLVTCWQGASRWVRRIWRKYLRTHGQIRYFAGPRPWRWPICWDTGVWAWPRPSRGSSSTETSDPTSALYHNSSSLRNNVTNKLWSKSDHCYWLCTLFLSLSVSLWRVLMVCLVCPTVFPSSSVAMWMS